MIYQILYAIFGLCFFIVPIWAYRKGLQDGLNIKQNKPMQQIKTPLKIAKMYTEERKETKKEREKNEREQAENQRFEQELTEMLNYAGYKGGEED